MSRSAAEVGSTANNYQILAKLASGGMAEIFLARGEGVAGVERYCVLKRILRDRASDVQFVQMFLDEARLAAQLQHPNIAQVHDIGKLGDSYFFTMEYVHGETVRALLHRAVELQRKLPISCVLTIVAGAAAGLHHAHVRVGLDGRALSIVHRDVSPSNLMVSYEGSVKLVDFGVAKASDRGHETKSGTVKGKISYLSPEQCRGKRVDRRSDLFSLGICFWEMLTAERLYRRASDFENMSAIVSEPPPAPSSRRDDIPAELDQLVLRLLAKDPDERCQTADEVVDAVETIAARTGSVLSGSALGRLVRELFGPRREPWLELERLQSHGERVTVTGEPIPQELAVPPADRIDHQLASVIDLSEPRPVTESLDALPASRPTPTTHLGKPGKRGFPLAAPPPTHPGVDLPQGLADRSTGKAGGGSALPSLAPVDPPGGSAPRSTLPLRAPGDSPGNFVPGSTLPLRAPGDSPEDFVPGPTVPLLAPGGAAEDFVPGSTVPLRAPGDSPGDFVPGSTVPLRAPGDSRGDFVPGSTLPLLAPGDPLDPRPTGKAGAASHLRAPHVAPVDPRPTGKAGGGSPLLSPHVAPVDLRPTGKAGGGSHLLAPDVDPAPPTVPESPRARSVTSSGVALPAPPEGPLPAASASMSFVAPAPAAVFGTPVPADPQAPPSGPFPAVPHATDPGSMQSRRIAWPLVAVIAGAAVLGSVAVVLAMRSGASTMASAASAPGAGADPAVVAARPAERPLIEPIEPAGPAEPGHPGAAEPGAPSLVAGASAPAAAPRAPIRAAIVAPALMAASVVPGDSSPARGAAPVAPKVAPGPPRGAPGSPPLRATEARDRSPDEFKRLYDDGHYELVVAQCGKGAIVADRVPLCFIAACHVRDEAAARRLVAQVPASRRERLVTNCKQFGVDLHDEGCEADPMSCQH